MFTANVRTEPAFKFSYDAEHIKGNREGELRPYKINNPSWDALKFTVEDFYLMHESLFKEILKQFQKNNIRVLK